MRSFQVEIVTPDGLAYSGEAESLLLRTTEGDVEILAGHADYMAALGIGRVRMIVGGEKRLASAQGGFISVHGGAVQMVATTFEFKDDIDLERARRAKEAAEAALREAKSKSDIALAEAKLKRALNRISVAEYK